MSLEVAPIRAHHPLILGPSTTEVNLFVASLMKERNEDNFVIWDLVHGVEVLATTIFENINQAVRVSSMRDDFKGLTPLHVLALQGKIDQIDELRVLVLEKIGGRGLLHFMALGGHIRHEGVRAYLAHSGENIARDLDEYSGSALDIAKIVEEKKATPVLGKFHICESHIPAVDLLKIWLMVRPEEPFLKRVREDREFKKGVIFSGKPEDAIELRETSGELGVEALASKDISYREEVSSYVGLFSASAMFSSLSDLCLIKKEAKSYFREEEINYENCDGIVDATEVCNKSVFINDGLPMTSLYVALKPILREEVLTTCYANHRMRWASSYIESVDAQAKRNILIERIKEKSLSSSRLTIEEGFIARWVVVTPQLLFRWLKNKEVEGESLRHLFIKVRDNFSDEPAVDRYIECMIAFFRLPEGLRELIIRNWLDVALSFDETRRENKEITFYCLFRVLEYVFKNMEEEFLRKNRALIEWEDPLNKTLGIKLGVIKL